MFLYINYLGEHYIMTIPLTFACQSIPGASMFLPAVTTALYIFIPVVIIESLLIKNILKKSFGQSLKFCIIANLISLLAGLLFAFALAFFIVAIFSLSEGLAAIICLLSWVVVPVILIWVENAVYKKCWKDISKKKLLKAVITVNVTSYIIFLISANYMKEKIHRERWEKNYRINCSSNLKQIGISLQQYAMDYNGFFPDKELDQLRTNDYLTDYGLYVCPGSGHYHGDGNQKLTEKNLDYIYRSGLKDNDGSDQSKTPLAWDRPTNHEDYGNVLFVNGHVKGFKGKDWMEQAGIKKTATQQGERL